MTSPWYNPRWLQAGSRALAEQVNAELTKIRQAFDLLPAPSAIGIGSGQPNYTWIAWADSADGTQNFSNVSAGNRAYIGTAVNKTVITPSAFPEDYVWVRVRGLDGGSGPQVILQYSVTGSGGWHSPYVAGDKYWRQSTDGGLSFSPGQRLSAATLAELDLAAANALAAAGEDIVALQSTVGSVSASVTAEASTRASADSALATQLTTVQTTVGTHTASITTQQTSINGLNAKYGVTIDVDGYITGYELNGTGTFGEAVFRVDKFKIVSPGNAAVVPFEVTGGVTYIKSAVIGDLTIGTSKLADNATFASASFYSNFNGYHRATFTYNTWYDVEDAFGTKARIALTTGAGSATQRVIIDATLTLARDGGDDDNTSWRVMRSDNVVLPQTYTNVQIANGRRQVIFAFVDDSPAAATAYTYTLQYLGLPSDGHPYFHNVLLRGVVHKK